MSSGELGASSFEFYEGIRIFIPGAACVALYAGVVATFGLEAPVPTGSIVGSALASLICGLFLYFVDFPSHSAAFRNGLPDRELAEIELPEGLNRTNFYFVLLDTEIPAGIKNRALYMGSMFRIGFELTYLMFATAVGVVSIALLVPSAGANRSGTEVAPVLWVGLGLFVGLFLLAISLDLLRIVRRSGKEKGDRWASISRAIVGFSPLDRCLLVLVLGLLLAYGRSEIQPLGGLAIAVPLATWAVRYQRGYPDSKSGRRPCPRSIAVIWASLAGSVLCIVGLLTLPDASALGLPEAVGWLATALFAAGIVVSRGPEKKIRGSYSTQRTWLGLNRWRIREYLDSKPGE
jgi:hypothetical protein